MDPFRLGVNRLALKPIFECQLFDRGPPVNPINFYQLTKFTVKDSAVGTSGYFSGNADGGAITSVYSPRPSLHGGKVFRNWSNDQFLVCLCQLPAQRDSPIPQHGKHVSKSRGNPMRRFVEHERPVFGGQPAQPLEPGARSSRREPDEQELLAADT